MQKTGGITFYKTFLVKLKTMFLPGEIQFCKKMSGEIVFSREMYANYDKQQLVSIKVFFFLISPKMLISLGFFEKFHQIYREIFKHIFLHLKI